VPPPRITRLVSSNAFSAFFCSCTLISCAMRFVLGSGANSLDKRAEVLLKRSRSTSTGSGSVVPFGLTISIWPAWRRTDSPTRLLRKIRPVPSRIINLMKASGWYSSITVVPVIAAVTAAVLICAPPASFGTRRSMAPPPSSRLRVPLSKLKIVFAPSRARVRSVNVSSARDSIPVRTAVPLRTSSLTAAGRGAACAGRSSTFLIT